MVKINRTIAEEYVEEVLAYKALRINRREHIKELRRAASTDYRHKNKGWFLTLDIIGIIVILLNFGALFMTGALAVKVEPSKSFAEANPVQCVWNGWSCHTDYLNIIIPMLKQIIFWAMIVGLYIYTRNNTFSITGMWVLTALIIFYFSAMAFDFNNDLGLYAGKIFWGR